MPSAAPDPVRCSWARTPLGIAYHDTEWGVPVHDDRILFEFLTLEGAQAGLSWETILNKRDAYRRAFAAFDPALVARFTTKQIERLLKDPGIVRNRLKINSTVSNAKAFLTVQKEFGSFDAYVWRFVGGTPRVNRWPTMKRVPPKTAESDALSRDLLKRGFKFVGSTICYAFMQAVGMVNDHTVDCFRYEAVARPAALERRPASMTVVTRRELLLGAMSACFTPVAPRAQVPKPRTRLILLGTGGGPTPKKAVSAPATLIIANDTPYVIDCGDGVARQWVLADVPLLKLRHIFITHQHSDHNADYGNLILLAWATGLGSRVDSWGPPPLAKMTKLFFEMNAYDIRTRISDEGRTPLEPLVHPHEFSRGGLVMADENVKVTSTLVDHPLVAPAFAYRFDAADRSIVISGDTARSDRLVALARGADVLVHEAMWLPAIDQILARNPNASRLRKHLLDSHTPVEDCGKVAAAAGVKTLVLSHLVPGGDARITDQMWTDAAAKHFSGRIVVGKDLMEI